MTDIVVRLPIRDAAEDAAFGSYLTLFVEGLVEEASRLAEELDAPFLMVRSEPQLQGDLRVLTFQQRTAARAFASGWRMARPTRSEPLV